MLAGAQLKAIKAQPSHHKVLHSSASLQKKMEDGGCYQLDLY
jgi:hypothetical protein